MRWLTLLALLGLVACGEGDKDDTGPDGDGLDPTGDEDGDGFTNGDEEAEGSDPYDATDVPYQGGWGKDADCRFDVEPTGNGEGQVAFDFALQDQYGDWVSLHDFCGRVVLIEFAGFG
jgi:hypothetical protein